MLIRYLGMGSVALLCGAALFQIVRPSVPRLLYNPSPSAPVGWYRVEPSRPVRRDELVAAFAPPEAAALAIERQYLPPDVPLIKTVWAVEGEQICHDSRRVRAPDRPSLVVLTRNSLGRSLPSKDGCYVLAEGEVFLVSTDVQTSFDSRYFGPVAVSDLLGPVRYLGRWRSRNARLQDRRETGEGAGHG
ncbi:S26 family signal peptidase [Algimonas porphyrae]|uniref:S26 family signal peptidase n=1 Tax=Algimonas porphyrae TaxID=1128113 RepID=UPI00352AF714